MEDSGATGRADDSPAVASSPGSRYKHLIENIQDAVVEFEFVDDEPIVRDVNEAFEETFGYDHDDISGESLNAWIVPEGLTEQANSIDDNTESGEITSHQLTRLTADGPREFLHRSVPYEGPGRIDGIAVYTDITERRRAERKRRLLSEATRSLGEAETLDEGLERTLETICEYTEWTCGEVWEPKHDGMELTFSVGYAGDPACEQFLDESRNYSFAVGEGLPGRVYDSQSPEWAPDVSREPPEVFHRSELARETGLRAALGAPVVTDGRVVAVLAFYLTEYRDTDDELIGHVTDVTRNLGELVARKQAEEVVKRRNEQLEEFADVISHDIRNPLNVAMTHLEMVRDEISSEHLGRISDAHGRMETIIEDVLTLARQGKSVDDVEPIYLPACVTQSWEMIQTGDASLDVEARQSVWGDESRVRQLLENLLRNALEHGPDDVTITVGDLPSGFYVADDGPGIPESEREQVFDFGYTTDKTGTGLGLPIVEEIAEAHGWTVTIGTGEDGGARFEFTDVDVGQ